MFKHLRVKLSFFFCKTLNITNMKVLSAGNIAKCAILAPIIVILLTIGWYQQTMNQLPSLNDNDKNNDSSFVIAGYFINW